MLVFINIMIQKRKEVDLCVQCVQDKPNVEMVSGPTMGWSLSYNMLEISGLMSDLLIVNNCSIITRINCII